LGVCVERERERERERGGGTSYKQIKSHNNSRMKK
jgi:hypothetical protein